MRHTPDIEHIPRKLVVGYLERISSSAFSDFPRQLTTLIGDQHGVYALYKGDRLYYVGLASNLRSRIKHHLRDRHSGKWSSFSLYLVRRAGHLHELESLMVRIADPRGNKSVGRLRHAADLKSELQSRVKAAQARQMDELLGVIAGDEEKRRPKPRRKAGSRRPPRRRAATLAPYVHTRFRIRAIRKGKRYEAQSQERWHHQLQRPHLHLAVQCGEGCHGRFDRWLALLALQGQGRQLGQARRVAQTAVVSGR